MKILFIVPYPLKESPSQRFRFEQYFVVLSKSRHDYQVQSFLSKQNWQLFYRPGNFLRKVIALLRGYGKRILLLTKIQSFDIIFIHRETSPLGPPIFEWIIAKLFAKKIIYDFDDAIWMTDNSKESSFESLLRWRNKISKICQWSYKISCGNDYLCSYARQFNAHVVLNPTTIDTEFLHNPDLYKKEASSQVVTIGWTGSHSTLKYLKLLECVLVRLEQQFNNIRFVVIANHKPDLALRSLTFVEWSKESEALDLLKIDIGMMPLPADEWTNGKCGFKALQYMAMGIPTVASPVGVNTHIITHNENGLLAKTDEEWFLYLCALITDPELRKKFSIAGRETVVSHYSVSSNTSNFLSLFT